VILQFSKPLLKRTDSVVERLQVNRSSFIRQAVEEKVERLENEQLEAELRDGYLQNADYYAASLQQTQGNVLAEMLAEERKS
jgi:metal-responsive CopG/Arc/MetJ family transcriptional regulator